MSEGDTKQRYNTNPLDQKVAERAQAEMGAENVDTEAPTREMSGHPHSLPVAGGPTGPIGAPTQPAPPGETAPGAPTSSRPVGDPTQGLYTPPPGAPHPYAPPPPYLYPPRSDQLSGSGAFGLKPNFAAMLGYIPFVGLVAAFLLVVLESKQNRFVRFHAKQALIAQLAFFVVWIVLSIASANAPGPLGILFFLARFAVFVGSFVGFIVMMAKAYQGERVKIPIIGDQAE